MSREKTEDPRYCSCGTKMVPEAPFSHMGERMYGRGVDYYVCWNPRCEKMGRKQ